ncbi:universal stress protein [Nakamurella flavida]|uniref:Universal stress protein n=1 Tax=Nakamurella flavida TaxID=363630 RepID=A0A939C4Q7_9ACTN|nr:universal stress protein [Nakamurella flavida]MBM9475979.1 universal stress protein [Nakamurella flavida]MBM9478361.1 universal stress protein [Nakamurella flavida]MDP9777732.1 nucleotide-binding universal stress UspA family protein [Nakamurella flavida]
MSLSADPADPPIPPGRRSGVVVGVDGSAANRAALDWAADTAAALAVPLTVLVAQPDHAADIAEFDPIADESAEASDGTAGLGAGSPAAAVTRTAVQTARDRHPDLEIHAVRYPDPPVQSLLAASERADLVVLGSHGWEGLTGLLVGSTVLHVVPYARCPVVVVPVTDSVEPRPGSTVVLGFDGSVEAAAAAAAAFRHAAAVGADVLAVYVRPRRGHDEVVEVDPTTEQLGSPVATFWAPVLLAAHAHPDVTVHYRHARGRAGTVLAEQARGAALLVVGARGRGGFRGLVMGSVSQHLLTTAPCPVQVLHSNLAR